MFKKGMASSFPDLDVNHGYDKVIQETKGRMENCDPCQAKEEIQYLIHRLKQIKGEYRSRPCKEGYCFNIFTPHKDRIDRRILAFESEKELLQSKCNDQLRQEGEKKEEERHQQDLQLKEKIHREEMELKKQMHEEEQKRIREYRTEETKKTIGSDKSSFHH